MGTQRRNPLSSRSLNVAFARFGVVRKLHQGRAEVMRDQMRAPMDGYRVEACQWNCHPAGGVQPAVRPVYAGFSQSPMALTGGIATGQ